MLIRAIIWLKDIFNISQIKTQINNEKLFILFFNYKNKLILLIYISTIAY